MRSSNGRYRLVGDDWVPVEHVPPSSQRFAMSVKDVAHVAVQLPRNHPAAPRVNKLGQPVFLNRREIDDFTAKTDGRYRWGDVPDGMPKRVRKPKQSYARPRS